MPRGASDRTTSDEMWKAVIREHRMNDASARQCDRLGCMGVPRVDELALPKSVERGNLSFSKTGIRWIG
jgi:hypothetical protein